MLPGDFDASMVSDWQTLITVGGVPVDAVSWEVDRAITHLPGDTSSSTGASAAGKLVPSVDPVVLDRARTPWTRLAQWPPRQGTPVTIKVAPSGSDTWIPVFTGLTDTLAGSSTGDLSVDLVERVDRFTRLVRIPPLQVVMPPTTSDGDLRETDDHHVWHINRAMEFAGFWTTIPSLPGSQLRVSMQGSLWPETGTCLTSAPRGDGIGTSRAYTPRQWGFTNIDASWALNNPISIINARFIVPAAGTGNLTYKFVTSSGATALQLNVNTATRKVAVLDASGTQIANTTFAGEVIALRYTSGGTLTLRHTGGTVTGTGSVATNRVTKLTLGAANGAVAGAINVADGNGQSSPSADYTPTARITGAAHVTGLSATPPSWDVTAASLLEAIATATCSHWGFDETGVAIFYPTLGLLSADVVGTITDDTDIIDQVQWSQDIQSQASMVHATFLQPMRRTARHPAIELWSGDGGTMDPGETVTQIAHPDTGIDWIQVDSGHHLDVGDTTTAAQYWGSLFVSSIDTGSNTDRASHGSEIGSSMAMLDPASYQVSMTNKTTSTMSARASNWDNFPSFLRSRNFPLLRGYATTEWVDGSIDSADDGSDAPIYEHDAAEWIGTHGDYIVGWIAGLLAADRVMLGQMQIRADPRYQLGDRVRLLLGSLGVRMSATITGKQLSFDAENGLTMTVSLLTQAATVDPTVWAQIQDHYAGETWQQVQNTIAGQTWSQFQNNPMQ